MPGRRLLASSAQVGGNVALFAMALLAGAASRRR